MTEEEKIELRELLAAMVADWEKQFPDLVSDEFIKLNEDSMGSTTTEAEILVFGLPRGHLHKLHVAAYAYDHLIGIVGEEAFDDGEQRLCELIVKARDACPPVRHYEHETPFRLKSDEIYWFLWFGKEFFGLREQWTFAFWHKMNFATSHLIEFAEIETTFLPSRDDIPF